MTKSIRRSRLQRKSAAENLGRFNHRNVGRPTEAERMFRDRGLSPTMAKLLANLAGFPVEGDS